MSYAQASADLGVHPTQLRNWVKQLADDPQHAFPGHGQMKPEQLEIAQLKREVARLKAERDILKKAAAYFAAEVDVKFGFIAKHRGIWPAQVVVRGARCLAGWILCLADTTSLFGAARPRRGYRREGSCQLPCERPDPWRQACVARSARRGHIVRSAPADRAIDAATGPESTSPTAAPAAPSGGAAGDPCGSQGARPPFPGSRSNRKWIADCTYLWTEEGWLYVAAVVDLFSRRVDSAVR